MNAERRSSCGDGTTAGCARKASTAPGGRRPSPPVGRDGRRVRGRLRPWTEAAASRLVRSVPAATAAGLRTAACRCRRRCRPPRRWRGIARRCGGGRRVGRHGDRGRIAFRRDSVAMTGGRCGAVSRPTRASGSWLGRARSHGDGCVSPRVLLVFRRCQPFDLAHVAVRVEFFQGRCAQGSHVAVNRPRPPGPVVQPE